MASPFTEHDAYLLNEGTHCQAHNALGAHVDEHDKVPGCWFAVWAPSAQKVSVIGDFNHWDAAAHTLAPSSSGVWCGFVSGAATGHCYKYRIVSQDGRILDKADPFASRTEPPPKTASVVWDPKYTWNDATWLNHRRELPFNRTPVSIYEVHIGSWMRVPDEEGRSLSYRELAPRLADYAEQMGFTHVELLPIMEHPFYGSWGYQVTGFFAPTARYGTPEDFMFFVDHLHQKGIGVILDWVPAHFPTDEHGLAKFDGTSLFEHADPRQGFHPDWNTAIFNYGRSEVQSFLLSSAMMWIDRYHIDGIRVDAVASMLYLDYSRKEGEWIPNKNGGRENLDAIDFLRSLNETIHARHPDALTIAEESTAWPGVSKPPQEGGLGFDLKWDMGWMHDTLEYFRRETIHRQHHQNELSFRMLYAFNERFMLPLSHDEVVHGKGSLAAIMPGDDWQKRANLRLLLGYQWAQPGKKLLFMGNELAGFGEWDHEQSLDWHLLQYDEHLGIQRWVEDLNKLYKAEPALYDADLDPSGFSWIDASDSQASVLSFTRQSQDGNQIFTVVLNCTPTARESYRVGVPRSGEWQECLNSDAVRYGGTGVGNAGITNTDPVPMHGHDQSLSLQLPPLGILFLGAPDAKTRGEP